MKTEELFDLGITPKEGKYAGQRFRVLSIFSDKVSVSAWDNDEERMTLKHGEYDIWQPPKTVFEDRTIPVTWGELKKGVEQKGLSDDTPIFVRSGFWSVGESRAMLGRVGGEKAIIFSN